MRRFTVTDDSSKTGCVAGVYIQDEWQITNQLTLNIGVRFDQMYQYIDANQFSPRVNLVYKPTDTTTFHAGYARYFTPPPQAIAAPANIAAFANTTAAPRHIPAKSGSAGTLALFRRRRVAKITPRLEVGRRRLLQDRADLLDDGQFGAALVLNGFNYDAATTRASS